MAMAVPSYGYGFGNGYDDDHGRPEANRDLWTELQRRYSTFVDAGGSFVVEWVKGHATTTHLSKGLILESDLWGNYVADALAGHASRVFQVVPSDSLAYTWALNATRRVQLRLIAIAGELSKEWSKQRKAELARLRGRSPHQVRQDQLAIASRVKVSEHGARVLSSHALVCIYGL